MAGVGGQGVEHVAEVMAAGVQVVAVGEGEAVVETERDGAGRGRRRGRGQRRKQQQQRKGGSRGRRNSQSGKRSERGRAAERGKNRKRGGPEEKEQREQKEARGEGESGGGQEEEKKRRTKQRGRKGQKDERDSSSGRGKGGSDGRGREGGGGGQVKGGGGDGDGGGSKGRARPPAQTQVVDLDAALPGSGHQQHGTVVPAEVGAEVVGQPLAQRAALQAVAPLRDHVGQDQTEVVEQQRGAERRNWKQRGGARARSPISVAHVLWLASQQWNTTSTLDALYSTPLARQEAWKASTIPLDLAASRPARRGRPRRKPA